MAALCERRQKVQEYDEMWHATHTTLLTSDPLEWQLTNAQRTQIGLEPVLSSWRLQEVPCGLLADRETYIYTDGLQIMRVISAGENFYEECCVDAMLTEDYRITPAKEGGKSVPLTAGNLHKRRKVGISLVFDASYSSSVIRVKDHTRHQCLLDLHALDDSLPRDIPGFARWLETHYST